jgi:hypothetical protein
MKMRNLIIPAVTVVALYALQGCSSSKSETHASKKPSLSATLDSAITAKDVPKEGEKLAIQNSNGNTIYEKVTSEGHVVGYKTPEQKHLIGSNQPSYSVAFLLDRNKMPYFVRAYAVQGNDSVQIVEANMQNSQLSFLSQAITQDKYIELVKAFRDTYKFKSKAQRKAFDKYIDMMEETYVVKADKPSVHSVKGSGKSSGKASGKSDGNSALDTWNDIAYALTPHSN